MKISKEKLNLALARKCWNRRDLCANGAVSTHNGKSVLPATVGKIAAALGVDVTEIIEDEG